MAAMGGPPPTPYGMSNLGVVPRYGQPQTQGRQGPTGAGRSSLQASVQRGRERKALVITVRDFGLFFLERNCGH